MPQSEAGDRSTPSTDTDRYASKHGRCWTAPRAVWTASLLQPVPGIMNPTGAARILVPTDFSDSSHAALEYGCTLARAFGARLSLLHVESDERPWTRETMLAARLADDSLMLDADLCELDANARLEQLLLPIVGRVPLVCGFTRQGRADEQILAFAEQDHSELIVMGSHGQTGAPVPLGSIAERVLHRATCPVLTIPSWTRHLHHVGAAWSVELSSAWAS
jgi:universal stress protein A